MMAWESWGHRLRSGLLRRLALVMAVLIAAVVLSPTEALSDSSETPAGTARGAFASLTAGSSHACAVLDDASVKCWGRHTNGSLGLGDTGNWGDGAGEMGNNLPAVDLGSGRTATAIAAGYYNTCALLDDASVKCWGQNQYGQLGLGDTDDRGDGFGLMGDNLPAVDLGSGRTATAITANSSHFCALLDDASIKCWGRNATGQLGLGDTNDRGDGADEMGENLPAVDLGSGRTATAITAGSAHFCALLDDASMKCWGQNQFGQLGQGDTLSRGDTADEMGDNLPAVDLGSGRTATAITADGNVTCALLDDASVKCWGRNNEGQLGQGDQLRRGDIAGQMGDNLPAVDLGSGRTAIVITAGSMFTCALLDDASVKCWGYNDEGQLGLGDRNDRGDGAGEMGNNLPTVDLGSGRTVRTGPSAPAQPAPPAASVSGTTATVSWLAPTGDGGAAVSGYVLQSSTDGVVWSDAANTTGTTADVAGLAGGDTVRFRVAAVNSVGTSPFSLNSNDVTPPAGIPQPPTSVSAVADDGQATVSWTAPSDDGGATITSYTVTADPGGAQCTTTGATSCTITGLTNGTSYAFAVTAANASGDGSASTPSDPITAGIVPGAPTGIAISPANGAITVTWTAPTSTGGTAITGYTATASPGGAQCTTTGATTCTITGLTNGTSYAVTVTAANASGDGSASTPSASATPGEAIVAPTTTTPTTTTVAPVVTPPVSEPAVPISDDPTFTG
ncbi:MAG TPA: hypothetical protein DCE75_07190 [Acidimicrobiaceae bacterium]|nr:hypothetical protein [Acidimicrobiaceae bacterium]